MEDVWEMALMQENESLRHHVVCLQDTPRTLWIHSGTPFSCSTCMVSFVEPFLNSYCKPSTSGLWLMFPWHGTVLTFVWATREWVWMTGWPVFVADNIPTGQAGAAMMFIPLLTSHLGCLSVKTVSFWWSCKCHFSPCPKMSVTTYLP